MICTICGNETENPHKSCKYCDCCRREKRKDIFKRYKEKNTEILKERALIKAKEKAIKEYGHISDLPICKICGFRSITLVGHMKKAHNITIKEYKQKFGLDKPDIIHHSLLEQISKKSKEVSRSGKDNPAYNHGGRYSPFSRNFIKYNGMTEEEKDIIILEIRNRTTNSIRTTDKLDTRLSYWLEVTNGDEDSARRLLRERQTTFSLQKCIDKHGDVNGTKIWTDRQEKWMKSLYDKSPEELERIHRARMCNGKSYSMISQELFWRLYHSIKDDFDYIKFAQLKDGVKDEDENRSNEMHLSFNNKRCFFIDFIVVDTKKIIEFDGDYWHGEKRGNKKRDHKRQLLIESIGYKVMRVLEREYRLQPQKIIQQCLDFLYDR